MAMRTVHKAGVVGLGTMGAGIAQLCVQSGIPTVAIETSAELVERGRSRIASALGRLADKGTITPEEQSSSLALLDPTSDLSALDGCELVIEAVFESLEVKHKLLAQLEEVVGRESVLATNTSALSVTEIAAPLVRPERVVGHAFLQSGAGAAAGRGRARRATSDAAFDTAFGFAKQLGKDPIACFDTPGFVVNRILIPVLNDAVRVLDEGVASPEDIDKGMCLGTSWPIGPLALIDLIGIDTYVHVCEALWESFREQRFAPPPRLVRMLEGRPSRPQERPRLLRVRDAMTVVISVENAIALVTVDRQEAMNALDLATVRELRDRLAELATDESVRCVIVTGAGGRAFIGGADIKYMAQVSGEQAREFAELGHEVGRLLETMPKPTIAAINGYALGGGCEVALACDIRYARLEREAGTAGSQLRPRPRVGRDAAARPHHDARIREGARPHRTARRRRGGVSTRPHRRHRRPGARRGLRNGPVDDEEGTRGGRGCESAAQPCAPG